MSELYINNKDAIEPYLREKAGDDTALQDYLVAALSRALTKPNHTEHLKPLKVDTLPEDAPAWMKQKFPNDIEFVEFSPTPKLDEDVNRVIHWLKGEMIYAKNHPDETTWLKKLDAKTQKPVRLVQIGELSRALTYAQQAI